MAGVFIYTNINILFNQNSLGVLFYIYLLFDNKLAKRLIANDLAVSSFNKILNICLSSLLFSSANSNNLSSLVILFMFPFPSI